MLFDRCRTENKVKPQKVIFSNATQVEKLKYELGKPQAACKQAVFAFC